MMKILYLIISIIIIPSSVSAQDFKLTNKKFVSSFKKINFSFNKVKPNNADKYVLLAGSCQVTDRANTDEEGESLGHSIDSLMFIHNEVIKYEDSIYQAQVKVQYYRCIQRNIGIEHQKCDSILTKDKDAGFNNNVTDSVIKRTIYLIDSFSYKKNYTISFKSDPQFDIDDNTKGIRFCSLSGFGTWCPPGNCNWFILSSNNNVLEPVEDISTLLKFLVPIDNPYKAYLFLIASSFGESAGYPQKDKAFKSKQVKDGFFIITTLRLSDCPIQDYECLISIGVDGEIKMLDKVQIGKDGGCI